MAMAMEIPGGGLETSDGAGGAEEKKSGNGEETGGALVRF